MTTSIIFLLMIQFRSNVEQSFLWSSTSVPLCESYSDQKTSFETKTGIVIFSFTDHYKKTSNVFHICSKIQNLPHTLQLPYNHYILKLSQVMQIVIIFDEINIKSCLFKCSLGDSRTSPWSVSLYNTSVEWILKNCGRLSCQKTFALCP